VIQKYWTLDRVGHNLREMKVGLEKMGPEKYFQVFFYYGQKNIFVDLHVSGNSKNFSPL
jgi:hypothetical protein